LKHPITIEDEVLPVLHFCLKHQPNGKYLMSFEWLVHR